MTHRINSIDINNQVDLGRSFEDGEQVQSIKINSADGTFYVSYPLDNGGTLIHYPQNLNNSNYDSITIKSVEDYGDLSFCLDVGIDMFGQRLWIADAGNTNVVALNLQDNTFLRVVEGITLPHSIIVNPIDRSVFIKSFTSNTTQKITQISKKGNILFEFEFPAKISSTTITEDSTYLSKIPKSYTMDYDSNLNRLWFVSESILYMIDLDTKQIVTQDLEDVHLYNVSCVSVDKSSGNAFVIIDDTANWYVQQVYKDNNAVLGTAYILEQPVPYTI